MRLLYSSQSPSNLCADIIQVNDTIKLITRTSPGGSDGKVSACNAGDPGSIPGSGRSPGEGNGNPLQHSCLENPMDEGAWCPWGRKELDMTERLHFHFPFKRGV